MSAGTASPMALLPPPLAHGGTWPPKTETAPTPTSRSPVILVVSTLTLLSLNTPQKALTEMSRTA